MMLSSQGPFCPFVFSNSFGLMGLWQLVFEPHHEVLVHVVFKTQLCSLGSSFSRWLVVDVNWTLDDRQWWSEQSPPREVVIQHGGQMQVVACARTY